MRYLYKDSEIANLSSKDLINWENIGYNGQPEYVKSGLDYAKEIKDNWDSSITSMEIMFQGDTKLVFMPFVDTSIITNMNNCFSGCSSLTTIPELDLGAVTSMQYAFSNCSSLTEIPRLDISRGADMYGAFANCSSLSSIPHPISTSFNLNMERCFHGCSSLTSAALSYMPVNVNYCFYDCNSLERLWISVEDITTDKLIPFGEDVSELDKLTELYLLNLGVGSYDLVDLSMLPNWVTNLTDTLDYACERSTECTIRLHSNVYTYLTGIGYDISSLEAKGYIIEVI